VSFSEQPPSKQWAALKYGGECIAEVWFKPEGEPFALTFRIPAKSFQLPGVAERLTPENLLKAVAVAIEEVASWRQGDVDHAATNGADPGLTTPLEPPPPDATYLNLTVLLKPPTSALAPTDSQMTAIAPERWQDLEARWNAIVGVEASIETLRQNMDGLRAELESSSRRSLSAEEKVHALNADVVQWNKAKTRAHYALPKVKEFIHRATWAKGLPERKRLEELFKNHIQPRIPFDEMEHVPVQLENLLKDRQVLSGHGAKVYQDCRSIATDIQSALRTLQSNAAARASQKRAAANKKGKYF
jgi:hypothetical protein